MKGGSNSCVSGMRVSDGNPRKGSGGWSTGCESIFKMPRLLYPPRTRTSKITFRNTPRLRRHPRRSGEIVGCSSAVRENRRGEQQPGRWNLGSNRLVHPAKAGDLGCHTLFLCWRRRVEMSCAAHRSKRRGTHGGACHAEARRRSARRRVLCFECYRARLDRPEGLRMPAALFPRVLTERELHHRRRMLSHLHHPA